MKIFIVVVCWLIGLARGSLEPIGYKFPGSYPRSNYLAPSSIYDAPKNRYLSSSFETPRTFPTTHDDSPLAHQSLPLENSPVPFSGYPPTTDNRPYHNRGISPIRGNNFNENSNPSSQYLSPNENRNSFVNSRPASDFLPPILNGASSERYSDAPLVHRQQDINRQNIGFHENRHEGRKISPGYRYNAPENHIPAKYDFKYEVKDNYGNDYGHTESRNGESARGVYTVLLPDGRRQIVHYEADSHGYRPIVTYKDTGLKFSSEKRGYQY